MKNWVQADCLPWLTLEWFAGSKAWDFEAAVCALQVPQPVFFSLWGKTSTAGEVFLKEVVRDLPAMQWSSLPGGLQDPAPLPMACCCHPHLSHVMRNEGNEFPVQVKQGHRAKMHPMSFPKAFQRPSCTPWPCLGPMGVQDNPHSLILCFLTGVDWALEKSQSCSIPKVFCCSSNACYCISGGHQLHYHSHPCPSPRPYA